MADVLRAAGLEVEEYPGWKLRGHGDAGTALGTINHHTAGPLKGDLPSLETLVHGRPDLPGPICNLALARSGKWTTIAAGKAWHAGEGLWNGVRNGNTNLIGIEAENHGYRQGPEKDFPWPDVQVDSYARGVAALLDYIGQPTKMSAAHLEYALPKGRKTDFTLDPNLFRASVDTYREIDKIHGTIKGHALRLTHRLFARPDLHPMDACDLCRYAPSS